MVRKSCTDPVVTPFTVLIDSRENLPFRFDGLRADADKQHRPIAVPTKSHYLPTGDYSLDGYQSLVCVERKSLDDLYGTIGQRREQFEAEHERMSHLAAACVVIESPWDQIINQPPLLSKLNPKVIWRTAVSWSIRYGVPWYALPNRAAAENWTFRFLEMFHRQQQHKGKRA
jgi:ERCC4-type nuclease